jgi:hypothetical protein
MIKKTILALKILGVIAAGVFLFVFGGKEEWYCD